METKKNIWFVAGTGTDVGKTVLTAGLLRAAHGKGLHVQAIKAVQTGCPARPGGGYFAPDPGMYREACPEVPRLAMECFAKPCSPHLAARLEGCSLSVASLADRLLSLAEDAGVTIVEGAGGVMVPLNERETTLDLMAKLNAMVILAVPNSLGAINHALLTLEVLRARCLAVGAIAVVNVAANPVCETERLIREDNPRIIKAMSGVEMVVEIPYRPEFASGPSESRGQAWKAIAASLDEVVEHLGAAPSVSPRTPGAIEEFDREHLWHPYATTHPPAPCRIARRTSANLIHLEDGRRLVDGMSSWWAAIHGYNHPELLAALHRQAEIMPHVMFGGFTHEPAAAAGERLLALAPSGLDRVFFVDSGSVAMEAALKMALQYQQAVGNTGKTRLATALGGYHGDTFGAMGLCDPVGGMHTLFSDILAKQLFVERPTCRFDDDFDPTALHGFTELFRQNGREIAAVVLEPIVQGAGGMWFYHPEYLRGVRKLCDQHGALLIFDEIATGFGRTGRMFACEWAQVVPDIMCVGKALTGGVLTLAAVLARDSLAEAISREGVFMHGPTFMANPLACAVAAKSLDILVASPWRERIGGMERALSKGLDPCRDMPGVADVRVLGGIGVVEMEEPVAMEPLQRFFVDEAGVWIRPFGRLIYLMPPYGTSESDVERLSGAVRLAVEGGRWK